MVKFCPKCGAEQKDHAKFCSKCGATFNVGSIVDNSNIKNNPISTSVPISNTNDNSSKNTLIIGITAIILVVIICLTCVFVFTDIGSDDSNSAVTSDNSYNSVVETSYSSSSSSDMRTQILMNLV